MGEADGPGPRRRVCGRRRVRRRRRRGYGRAAGRPAPRLYDDARARVGGSGTVPESKEKCGPV